MVVFFLFFLRRMLVFLVFWSWLIRVILRLVLLFNFFVKDWIDYNRRWRLNMSCFCLICILWRNFMLRFLSSSLLFCSIRVICVRFWMRMLCILEFWIINCFVVFCLLCLLWMVFFCCRLFLLFDLLVLFRMRCRLVLRRFCVWSLSLFKFIIIFYVLSCRIVMVLRVGVLF